MKYNVILPSYEITKGMKSFGSKCLMPVKFNRKNDLLLSHQINYMNADKRNIAKFILVLGYEIEKIKKKINIPKNIEVLENKEYESYGFSHAVGQAIDRINNKYPTMIFGSGVIIKNKLTISNSDNIVYVSKKAGNFNTGCVSNKNNVEHLFYNLQPYWIECCLLQHDSLSYCKQLIINNQQMMFFEILNELIKFVKIEKIDIKNNLVKNVTGAK